MKKLYIVATTILFSLMLTGCPKGLSELSDAMAKAGQQNAQASVAERSVAPTTAQAQRVSYGKNIVPYKGYGKIQCSKKTEKKYSMSLQPRGRNEMLLMVYEGLNFNGKVLGNEVVHFDPEKGFKGNKVKYNKRDSIEASFIKLGDGTRAMIGTITDSSCSKNKVGELRIIPYKDAMYTRLGD